MENKGFLFLRSYYDAINDFDFTNEQKGFFIDVILQYVFEGVEPEFEKGIYKGCWTLIKPTLDNSLNRYSTAVENGKKGGAPKGTEPWNKGKKKQLLVEDNPNNPSGFLQTQHEPNTNLKQTQSEPNTNLKKEKEKEKEKEIEKEIEKENKIEFRIPSIVEEDELDSYLNGGKTFKMEPTIQKPKNSVFSNIEI